VGVDPCSMGSASAEGECEKQVIETAEYSGVCLIQTTVRFPRKLQLYSLKSVVNWCGINLVLPNVLNNLVD